MKNDSIIMDDWEMAFVEPWGFVWVDADGNVVRKATASEIEEVAESDA